MRNRFSGLIGAFLLSLFCQPLMALEVGLAGIMGSKALVVLGGGEPRPLAIGQSIDGVRLLSLQGDQAIFEIDGKKRPLRVGQHAQAAISDAAGGKITLHADGQGHFYATGTVNGTSLRFLVDTGASLISLGASDARRLGIDTSKGVRGISETANGQVTVVRVKLDTVRIGEITVHNVDALVRPKDMPIAPLGMSFLSRMEMLRDGSTMTLKKRY